MFLKKTDFCSEKSTFCTTRKKDFPSSSCMFSLCICVKSQRKRKKVLIMSRLKKKKKRKDLFPFCKSYISICTLLKEGKKVKQLSALANCPYSHVTFSTGTVRVSGEQQQGIVSGDK